jgi:hypothetical protein
LNIRRVAVFGVIPAKAGAQHSQAFLCAGVTGFGGFLAISKLSIGALPALL